MTRLPIRYLAGSFLARLAEEGMGVAVVLLAAERTGEVTGAAVLMAAWLAPHILVAPLVGALAARVRHPEWFYTAAMVGFAGCVAAVVTLLGVAPLWVVLVAAVLGGCCGPVISGGLSSLVASLLPPSAHARGYALDSAGYNAASVAGPALATAVSVSASAEVAGYLLAAMALLAGTFIAGLPIRVASVPKVTLRADLVVGLVCLWRNRVLRAVTAATCLAYFGLGGLTVTAVLLARQWGNQDGGGILITGFALGALLAAGLLARRPPRISPQRLAGISLVVTGMALGLAAVMPHLLPGLVLFILAGAGDGPLLSATLQARAAHSPPGSRAQVFTTGAALKLSAAAAGAVLTGLAGGVPAGLLLAVIAASQLAGATLLWIILATGRHTAVPPSLQSVDTFKKSHA